MFFESFLLNLSVIIILVIALTFDYVTKFFSYWYIRHIPYKTPVPFFGSDYHRILGIRNTTQEIDNLYKTYQDKYIGTIRSRIPDLIVKDTDSINSILATDFSNFHCRGTGLDRSQDVCIRNNLFYSEGEKWTLLRAKLELLLNSMSYEIQDSLHDCLSGTNGDTKVQQLLSDILDVVFKNLLIDNNLEEEGLVLKSLREMLQKRSLLDKLKSYLRDVFPSLYVMFGLSVVPGQWFSKFVQVLEDSKLMKDIKKMEMVFGDKVNSKKVVDESNFDMLCSYLTLFIEEGYVPCHYVLTGLLFELAKNGEVQDKARKCGDGVTDDDYLSNVIKEALRMYPPYSVITRKCVKTYQFAGKDLVLDKGMFVSVPIEAVHRDDSHHKDPNVFNPNRFLESNCLSNSTFLPFGAGPRKCIGEELALHIIRNVTTVILKKFSIQTCDTELRITDYNFKRIVDGDVWLRFTPIS